MDGPARLSDSLGPLISAFVGLWTCEDEGASCGRRGHQSAMKAFMAGPLQSPPQTWTGWRPAWHRAVSQRGVSRVQRRYKKG